ncbi:MAG: hypothetical protein ACYC91_03265 [Solirubrobacteraceae bacterium]
MRRSLVLVLTLLTVAAGAAISAAPAAAFSKAIWGPITYNGVDQFPLYHRLGVGIYETDLNWSQIALRRPRHPWNPRDPAYAWPASLNRVMAETRRWHMQVMLQLIGTPSWANGGRASNWAPNRPGDFAAFAAAAARRYPSVRLWMIWGEPTRHANFEPLRFVSPNVRRLTGDQLLGPHTYARLLDSAYGALKSVRRSNQVIGGSTFTAGDIDTLQWIENLRLPNGRPARMDMYAHNPFSLKPPNFSDPPSWKGQVQFSDLERLAGWVDRYLHPGLPLFLSEFTFPTAPDQEFTFYVDAPVAARWTSDALRLSRRWKRIYALGWIHVYDDPPNSYGGLMTVTGKPKPTFYAFERG